MRLDFRLNFRLTVLPEPWAVDGWIVRRELVVARFAEQTLGGIVKSQFENIGCCLKGQHPNPLDDRFATYRRTCFKGSKCVCCFIIELYLSSLVRLNRLGVLQLGQIKKLIPQISVKLANESGV